MITAGTELFNACQLPDRQCCRRYHLILSHKTITAVTVAPAEARFAATVVRNQYHRDFITIISNTESDKSCDGESSRRRKIVWFKPLQKLQLFKWIFNSRQAAQHILAHGMVYRSYRFSRQVVAWKWRRGKQNCENGKPSPSTAGISDVWRFRPMYCPQLSNNFSEVVQHERNPQRRQDLVILLFMKRPALPVLVTRICLSSWSWAYQAGKLTS